MNENTRTSMENAIGEIKVSQKSDFRPKIYERTDGIFSIICMLMGLLFVRFFIFDFWYVKFDTSMVVFSAIYVSAVIFYARSKGKNINSEAMFWLAVLAVIAVCFKTENFFRLTLAICVAAYFSAITGGLYENGTSSYILMDLYSVFVTRPFYNFFSVIPAFFSLFRRNDKKEKIKISPAVWGVILAVVALWFIMPLLFAADSNFLSGAKELREYMLGVLFGGFDIFTIAIHILFGTPIGCYIFGLCYGSMSPQQYGNTAKEIVDDSRRKMRIFPAVTLKVFMYIVCFVYLLFIMLQAEYLLGAFIGRLYSGMTYAQYARTGFFELCRVAGINLSLLAICNLLIIKNEEKAIKTPMVLLCVLSLLLLSTATAKMAMYISVYGLTVKRVISTVFLLWMITVFVMCIARLYKPYNLVKAAVLTGAVMFCVLFSFDIGLHSENFNNKYGFAEKATETETISNGTIYLPDMLNVTYINVSFSDGTYFHTISNTVGELGKLYRIFEKAISTDMQSVQDLPSREKYYTITIHRDMFENQPDVTIYCYEKHGEIYLEQPYNGIWITDENLPYMFENYII